MNTQSTIDNKFTALLEFLSSAQTTCVHTHNAWCASEASDELNPGDNYIASLKNPELEGQIKAIEELLNDIHAYTSEAAHKLEAIIEDASASIGYEFKALDGEIQKKKSV